MESTIRKHGFVEPDPTHSRNLKKGWKSPESPGDVRKCCPEVSFWSITLSARSLCGTCPRSRFLGSFTDHFDGLPTTRTSASETRPKTAKKRRTLTLRGFNVN